MKAVVAAFNQEKALVGAFSVITNLRIELFQALGDTWDLGQCRGAMAATLFIGAQLNQHRYLGPGSDIVSVRAAAVNTCHLPTQGYKN